MRGGKTGYAQDMHGRLRVYRRSRWEHAEALLCFELGELVLHRHACNPLREGTRTRRTRRGGEEEVKR